MKSLIGTLFLVAFSFNSAIAQSSEELEIESITLPLYSFSGNSILLYGTHPGNKTLPDFISADLAKKIDPEYNPEYIENAEHRYNITIDEIMHFNVAPAPRAEMLTAMGFKSKDQIHVVFQNNLTAKSDLLKTSMKAERYFAFSEIRLQLEPGNKTESGYAWIGDSNPFKKDPQIKSLELLEQKPKYIKADALAKKLLEENQKFHENYPPPENKESTQKVKCENRPSRSASYGGIEFFSVTVFCTGTDSPYAKTEVYFTDGKFLKLLYKVNNWDGNFVKQSVRLLDIFNDYTLMLEESVDYEEDYSSCPRLLLRDKKGRWKAVTPPCPARSC